MVIVPLKVHPTTPRPEPPAMLLHHVSSSLANGRWASGPSASHPGVLHELTACTADDEKMAVVNMALSLNKNKRLS